MGKKRGNSDGSIRQRNDGTWEARFMVGRKADGKPDRRSVYASTQKEAIRRMHEAQAEIAKNEYIAPDGISVGQWLDTWFLTYSKPYVRPSTALIHSENIRLHLKPCLGRQKLQQLRTEHIQSFINAQQEKGYAPTTIKRQLTPLKSALKQALENRLISRNPADFAKMPKMSQKEIAFLNKDEQSALIQVLPKNTTGRAIRFILGTGLRVSELCGLRWQDIGDDCFSVNQVTYMVKDVTAKEYKRVIDAPKTTAGKRTIPLTLTMRVLLNEQKTAQQQERLKVGGGWDGGVAGQGETYIFANALGNPMDRNNLGRCLRACLKKAGLKSRGLHALRHTFATNWVQAGNDLRSLSEILGHTNVGFTMQQYVHSDLDTKRAGMEAMENSI